MQKSFHFLQIIMTRRRGKWKGGEQGKFPLRCLSHHHHCVMAILTTKLSLWQNTPEPAVLCKKRERNVLSLLFPQFFVSKLLDAFLCWYDVVKGSGGWKKCAKCDESALFLCWAIVDNVAVLLLPVEKTWGSHLQITLSYAATLLQLCSRDAFSPSKNEF